MPKISDADKARVQRDMAPPRSAAMFTGYAGNSRDGARGPSGTLVLAVANHRIPCTLEGVESNKSVSLTVLNVHKTGWSFAPWKKQVKTAKAAKGGRDENTRPLFEVDEWASDVTTLDRVVKSVRVYTFSKDGNNKGPRLDDFSVLSAGQTLRFVLQTHMFETKADPVLPADMEWIEPFSVVEVMITAANSNGFEAGYGLNIGRIRPTPFTLHSLNAPLGLHLLPRSYHASTALDEPGKGVVRMLEPKNTGFFVDIQRGSYVVPYKEGEFRIVGPKESSTDPGSRHLEVAERIFAIDMTREDMHRFTNACNQDPEFNDFYARFVIDLAAAAGALSFYVVHNEFRLRQDPSRMPFVGVPVVDTDKLLGFIDASDPGSLTTFALPFEVPTLQETFAVVDFALQTGPEVACPCPDFALCSEGGTCGRAYPITFGDSEDDEILTVYYSPKNRASGVQLDRMDYRLCKKQRV